MDKRIQAVRITNRPKLGYKVGLEDIEILMPKHFNISRF